MAGLVERTKQRARELADAQMASNQAAEQFNTVLDLLRQRASQADQRASLSSRDLFGDQIDRSTDIIRSGANQRKRALAGVHALRGGDITGSLAAELARTDQGSNQALRDLIMGFEDRATGVQERALGRGDQLANLLMRGQGEMLGFHEGRFARDRHRQDLINQARRQQGFDLLGLGAGVAGTILAGPIGGIIANRLAGEV